MNLGDLHITIQGPVVIASLTGEVDLSNATSIEEAIVAAIPNDAQALLVDLKGLDYMDSAGIRILYRLREKLQNRGQRLKLILSDESPAMDALRLAGVVDYIEIVPTVEQAVA